MFENFEVKPMFEDQFHERHQFKLTVEGNDYLGLFHEGEIHWFNPHPKENLGEGHVDAIESQVHEMMSDHLEQ